MRKRKKELYGYLNKFQNELKKGQSRNDLEDFQKLKENLDTFGEAMGLRLGMYR